MLTQGKNNLLAEQPLFSGHETFPMRYGWLKKAYDAITVNSVKNHSNIDIFNSEEAIAYFGVGRNMVRSIKHWATYCDIIKEGDDKQEQRQYTTIGEKIFDDDRGLDPYMENPATLWLIHFQLATNEKIATWFSVFNLFNHTEFTRETLVRFLEQLCFEQNLRRVAKTTLKRDVECFIRTYVPFQKKSADAESIFETPLVDLGLIQSDDMNKFFRMYRSDKPTLGQGVFTYSVLRFWNSFTKANTLSIDALLHQPKSPGRVFQLSENFLVEQLLNIEETTRGAVKWSETAGMKQLIRDNSKIDLDLLNYINIDYK